MREVWKPGLGAPCLLVPRGAGDEVCGVRKPGLGAPCLLVPRGAGDEVCEVGKPGLGAPCLPLPCSLPRQGVSSRAQGPLLTRPLPPQGPKGESVGSITQPLPSSYLIFRAASESDGECPASRPEGWDTALAGAGGRRTGRSTAIEDMA